MKKYFCCTIAFVLSIPLFAQSLDKAVNDAFLITRMMEKYHVQPKSLNDELSVDLFNRILKELDAERIIFTTEDIAKLEPYRLKLDDLIKQKNGEFLQLLSSIYQVRLSQSDAMINSICKTPFNFTGSEKVTVREDSSYATSIAELRNKLYKSIKASVLNSIVQSEELPAQVLLQKKFVDSIEVIARKKMQKSYKRSINKWQQHPGGLSQGMAELFCESLALCYDPHTSWFGPSAKENFESMVGGERYQFGFQLDESDDAGVKIEMLRPGSPAFKSGVLNKGDKIETLQWEGQKTINVSDASVSEVSGILSANNHDKLVISVKKADGTLREVTLQKEKVSDDGDENKVRSFLLKGAKTMGYISLPAFYTDWLEMGGEETGCANDVAKEIVKLKKENIDGLVLDVRYNGGGSMKEAIDLSGIFIDAGPVGQIQSSDSKIYRLKDANRGTIYDGPLLLLVNGYSASASEMIAGTLQDYNRALIVGTPTYGKATAQVILPLDTAISLESSNSHKKASSYIKVTNGKLYRVTGATAQGKGVQPDILLPDLTQVDVDKEVNEPNTLIVAAVEANKYYKAYAPLPVASLKAFVDTKLAASDHFKAIIQYIAMYKKTQQPHDISLNLIDATKEKNELEKSFGLAGKTKSIKESPFTITNNSFESQRIAADASLSEINDQLKKYLLADEQLHIAYELISQMNKK